jgi:FKBP-type peptidyl-prolyl cis-trans isomerase SlpA
VSEPELAIQAGSEVVLHVRIQLDNGITVEDTHATGDPLCLRIGDGSLLARLEALLLGLQAGDKRSWSLAPGAAFGTHDAANVKWLAREHFPATLDIAAGQIIAFSLPDGSEVPGSVLEAGEDDLVQVDFNHPLAGRTIRFEVEIIAVAETG